MNTQDAFAALDIRVGKIIAVSLLPNPRYTTHKLTIDLGPEIGQKTSGARVLNYTQEELMGKLVLCVINLPPKQIGGTMSEVLTLGVPDAGHECVLISPDNEKAVIGGKLY